MRLKETALQSAIQKSPILDRLTIVIFNFQECQHYEDTHLKNEV